MADWTQHSLDEWHSEEAGYGVAAWPTGWAVYVLGSSGPTLHCGRAESYSQAQDRAQWVARSLRILRGVLDRCEETSHG